MADRELDRRHFLRASAGALAGPVIGASTASAWQGGGPPTQASVLIIGAGPAGITAAYFLKQAGISSIVLEGNIRVGGRILTSTAWPDAPMDLGASWLSHAEWSPVAQLVKRWGIATVDSDLSNFAVRRSNGALLSADQVLRLTETFAQTYLAVKGIAAQREAKRLPDIPASTAFAQVLAARKLSPPDYFGLNWFINLAVKEPWASPLCDLSLYNWDQNFEFDFVESKVFPQGYVQVVDRMIRDQHLDVRLGHLVREIDYGPRGVFVSTSHGEFFAPYAIVTLPLGVLRSRSVTFSPPLPAWKRGAINRLHFGVVDKCYFRFPRVFWDVDRDGVHRIASSIEQPWSVWFNFYKYTGKPILMVFNENEYARRLEGMSDTQVMDAGMAALRGEFGRSIPDPIGFQRSKWGTNPFSLGTVPHVAPGASNADFDLMAAPVPGPGGRLLFAGDATYGLFPGLVLGAFLSAQREAGRIAGAL